MEMGKTMVVFKGPDFLIPEIGFSFIEETVSGSKPMDAKE